MGIFWRVSPISPRLSNLVGSSLSTLAFREVLIKFSQQMDLRLEIANRVNFIEQNVPTQGHHGAAASLERTLAKSACNRTRAL